METVRADVRGMEVRIEMKIIWARNLVQPISGVTSSIMALPVAHSSCKTGQIDLTGSVILH